MGLLDCLHIALPAFTTVFLAFAAPIGYKVWKTGVRATASYLIGLPTTIWGYLTGAYASKVTKIFAVATALTSTIHAATVALSTRQGWMHLYYRLKIHGS